MPITAWVDEADKLARFEIIGEWTTEEMLRAVSRTLDALGGREGFDLLSDHRLIGKPATPEQIRALVGHLSRTGSALAGRRAAVVVGNAASYGMMRMLGVHAESIGIEVGIFATIPEAMEWLRRTPGHSGVSDRSTGD